MRLNRPAKLNALSPELMSALCDAVTTVEHDPATQVLVITGNGRAFCSGGDLGSFQRRLAEGLHDEINQGVKVSADALAKLAACTKPVIAAVNGTAVAGGLEMILCCDIVIAAAGALIGDGHLKYGVLPGGGGAVRLMRKLPPNVAKWLLLTGSLVTAERFLQWGLVNEVVEPQLLETRVAEIAADISRLSPLALAHVKRVAEIAVDAPVVEALAAEYDAFCSYSNSHDFDEGVRAFAEKRQPRFLGR